MTEEHELSQREIYEAERQLERSHRLVAIGSLMANVVHEIRNPLSIIRAKIETLFDRPRDEAYLRACREIIIENADRIEFIIQGMLKLASKKKPAFAPVDLSEIAERCLSFFVISRINLVKEISPVPQINGVFGDLHEVFVGLIQNAIDAMPEGGTLKVRTYSEGDRVAAEISDTGRGIPEEIREKIFDPFFTTHRGAGLGLSVVHRIVREHGGDISIESKVGKGTTFKLLFPRAG